MSKNIGPTRERIREIAKILMDPKNNVARRLKKFQLYDWHDPKNQRRYQPLDVAAIIAWAELGKKIHYGAIEDYEKKKQNRKNKFRRLKKQIEKTEKTTKQNFGDLPSEVRMSSLFQNKKIIGPYHSAIVEEEKAMIKKGLLRKGKKRPKEKYLDTFCLDMKRLFAERTGTTSNYQLIADIDNIFNLSSIEQTYRTIYQRLYRLKK